MSDKDGPKTGPDENEDDEKVGFRNAPKHSRFKPKHSGNAKGRPNGAMGHKGIVEKIAFEVHRVDEGGKSRRRTTYELVILTLRDLALKGDVRAHDEVHKLLMKYGPQEPDRPAGYIVVPETLTMAEWEAYAQEVQANQEDLE